MLPNQFLTLMSVNWKEMIVVRDIMEKMEIIGH